MVSVQIKADRIEDFKKVMNFDSEQSRLEPGCLRFDTFEDAEDPTKFTFYEVYKNMAAVDEHKKTKHYADWAQFKESGGVESQTVQKSKGLFF